MRYFLILFIFCTMNSFAQQEAPQKFKINQKVSVLRSDGSFSNATIIDVDENGIRVHIDNAERGHEGGALKTIRLDQAESQIGKPLKIPVGHLQKGDVVSFPRTGGGKSNGSITEIQGTRAKVEWVDDITGASHHKWVDVGDVDLPTSAAVFPPVQQSRQEEKPRSKFGEKLLKRFKWLAAAVGVGQTLYTLATEGVGESLDTAAQAIHDTLGGADLIAGEVPVEDYLQGMKTAAQKVNAEARLFSERRQGLTRELTRLRGDILEDASLSDEERQNFITKIDEIHDIVQPPGPPRNPPTRRHSRGDR